MFWIFESGTISELMQKQNNVQPSVIVIGSGISGLAAARNLSEASFKVMIRLTYFCDI